jgi:hypothetical protein
MHFERTVGLKPHCTDAQVVPDGHDVPGEQAKQPSNSVQGGVTSAQALAGAMKTAKVTANARATRNRHDFSGSETLLCMPSTPACLGEPV